MKHFIISVAALLILTSSFTLRAQEYDTLSIHRNEKGIIQFLHFKAIEKSDRKMAKDTLFLKSVLHTKSGDSFRLTKTGTDELGITHKRFQQYYQGLKIENAEYLIHGKNGNIDVINGDFQRISITNTKPAINEQQALTKALVFVGARKYKWEDEGMERFIKQHTNNPKATFYPNGEL